MSAVKFNVLSQVWLVPEHLVSVEFQNAVDVLNDTPHNHIVKMSEAESEAFHRVLSHPEVLRPL